MLWDALFSEPSKESIILSSPITEFNNLFIQSQKSFFEVGVELDNGKRKKMQQKLKHSVLDIFRDNLNINLPGDLLSNSWIEVNIDNARLQELVRIHFLQDKFRKVTKIKPANRLILLSTCARAFLIWGIGEIAGDQSGVQCILFRNASTSLSSKLIADAEKQAITRWPQYNLFTVINAGQIKSVNPGYCFKRAGWKFVKRLRGSQHLLVRKTSGNY